MEIREPSIDNESVLKFIVRALPTVNTGQDAQKGNTWYSTKIQNSETR